MKKLKKLLSIVLVLTMVLSLNVVSFASTGTYTITITNDTDGYVYTAYQIFAGTLATDGTNTLDNITWGSGVDSTDAAFLAALTTAYGTTDAAEIAATLTTTALAEAFAEIVGEYLVDTYAVDSTYDSGEYTIGLTDAGYYLVKNTTVPDNGAYTSYILEVVKDVPVDEKASVPSMTKNVMETNDTDGTTAGWQDTADYDVGDSIPFRLTGTVASNVADYDSYKYIFHDVMSTGLELDTDVDVVVTIYPSYTTDSNGVVVPGGTGVVVASGYTVVTSGLNDDCSFEVQFTDLLSCLDDTGATISVTASSLVVVEFNAKLTSSAVVGNNGNPNTAYLEYANNPYNETDTGSTPWDTNVVFTYEVDVNKVKSDGTSALEGAEFTLYKKVKYSDGDTGTFYSWDSTEGKYVEVASPVDGETYCILVGVATASGTENNEFSWSGLDAGDYVLVETVTPTGYNTMDNVEFTITAKIDNAYTAATVNASGVNSYGEAYLTDLSATVTSGSASFTGDEDEGTLTANIINNAGSELPSTGGIGTTIFYVVGGILILGAVVLLITKKRMNSEER